MPTLFAIKGRVDALAGRLRFVPRDLSDKFMQAISRLFPQHLPRRIKEYRDKYEDHLMPKTAGTGIGDARIFLESIFPSGQGAFFECTEDEGERAFLHRFAAAGAAIRYRATHRREVEDIVALDVALRRNDRAGS
jgi:D-lactate dehydrogenase (quinone)